MKTVNTIADLIVSAATDVRLKSSKGEQEVNKKKPRKEETEGEAGETMRKPCVTSAKFT